MEHKEKLRFFNAFGRYSIAVFDHSKHLQEVARKLPRECKDLTEEQAKEILQSIGWLDTDECYKDLEAFAQKWWS